MGAAPLLWWYNFGVYVMKPLPSYRDPELPRRCDTMKQLRACQRIRLYRMTRDYDEIIHLSLALN